MKLLVTGTSGFLGSAIRRHFSNVATVYAISGRFDFAEQLSLITEIPDVVIHCGFAVDFSLQTGKEDPFESPSVRNTRHLVDWLKLRPETHFIFVSAAAVLGVSCGPNPRSETQLEKSDPPFESWMKTRYVSQKLAAESLMRNHLKNYAIIYPTTIFGPGMNAEILKPLTQLKRRKLLVVPPGGTSFMSLSDFLNALELVVRKRVCGSFVFSSGNLTYREMFSTAARRMGTHLWIIKLPPWFAHILSIFEHLPQRRAKHIQFPILKSAWGFKYYSNAHAVETLSWTPRSSFDDALREASAFGASHN